MVEQSTKTYSDTEKSPSKVIVVAGFLGAGKTTLIESILQAPSLSKRVAVIQNEFSPQMGLESSLMKDSNGEDIEDFYEMPNGCICCAAKDDLIQTLDSLLENNQKSGKPKLEFILVETNGLADPCQVVQTFWLDDFLCSKVQLHSCVSLVDCKDFASKLDSVATKESATTASETLGSVSTANSDFPENELLLRQLIYADKILINKIDLIDESSRAKSIDYVQDCVARVNNSAKITVTQYSKIDLDYLIAPIDSYTQVSSKTKAIDTEELKKVHALQHEIVDKIQSHYIMLDESKLLDRSKFEPLMGQYLWEPENDLQIMRCKGKFNAVNDEGKPSLYILQGVGDVFEFREVTNTGAQKDDVVEAPRFLFVGRNIDAAQLQKDIAQCSE